MSEPVREALYTLLNGDKTLEELSNGVFFELAPSSTERPYVIFRKQSGIPSHTFGLHPLDRDRWLVKGVGDTSVAEAIHLRCRTLLEGTTFKIEGKYNHDVRRVTDVSYSETVGSEKVQHIGAEYKLDTEYEK